MLLDLLQPRGTNAIDCPELLDPVDRPHADEFLRPFRAAVGQGLEVFE